MTLRTTALLLASAPCACLVLSARPRVQLARMPAASRPVSISMADDESVAIPAAFLERSPGHVKDMDEYRSMHKRSLEDPSGFWGDIASEFHWETKWDTVVEANFAASKGTIFSKWFSGGKTNVCYNAVDRHVAAGFGDQIAFYHEANDESDDQPHWTYKQVQPPLLLSLA